MFYIQVQVKIVLKINWSVKTSLYEQMGAARSGLWAPDSANPLSSNHRFSSFKPFTAVNEISRCYNLKNEHILRVYVQKSRLRL